MGKFIPDKPGQQFLIRMKSGFFYQDMEQGRIMVTDTTLYAFKFRSRLAALQVCGTTAEFAGAWIVPYEPNLKGCVHDPAGRGPRCLICDPPPAQPEAQGAIRADLEGDSPTEGEDGSTGPPRLKKGSQ